MKASPHPFRKQALRTCQPGFTLVELLVVMVIISILATLTLTSLRSPLGGINLKGGADQVLSELSLARQTATTRNVAVEVRIYKIPNTSGISVYRAIALVIPASATGAAQDEFVGKPTSFKGDVVISPDTTYSSLLNPMASAAIAPIAGTESTTAPLLIQKMPYVKFTFLPTGSVNLDGTVPWCLTLTNEHQKPGTGVPAANYVAIVLDTQSGRGSFYQP